MADSEEACYKHLLPIFPREPPHLGGRLPRGVPVVFQHPRDDWPTERLETVLHQAKGCLDAGAQPALLVPVIDAAREILERRQTADDPADAKDARSSVRVDSVTG